VKIKEDIFMNPKALNHLDPKMQETYNRIMGTATNTNAATPPPFDANLQSRTDANVSEPLEQNTATVPTSFEPEALSSSSPIDIQPNNPSQLSNTSFFSNASAETLNPTIGLPTTETNQVPNETLSQPNEETKIPDSPISSTPITPYTPANEESTQNESMYQPLPSPSSINQQAHKETSPLLKVLYIIGAVIFFLIYTVFWIKVFNLPFLF
jgi:hypothetical protein